MTTQIRYFQIIFQPHESLQHHINKLKQITHQFKGHRDNFAILSQEEMNAIISTHQERIVTVGAGDSAHSRHGCNRWRHRTWRQVDYALAVWSGTSNSLRRTLAYQEAVTRAADIFFARWCISNRLEKRQSLECPITSLGKTWMYISINVSNSK